MKYLLGIALCCLLATGCTCNRDKNQQKEERPDSSANYMSPSETDSKAHAKASGEQNVENYHASLSEATSGSSNVISRAAPGAPVAQENTGHYQTYDEVQAESPMASPEVQEKLEEIKKSNNKFLSMKTSLPDPAKIYQQQCASCHGNEGRGDGPMENTLGIAPTNFHEWELKYGEAIENIVYTIKYNQMSEEVHAFEGKLKEDEIWSVAFYVQEWIKNRQP